VVTAVGLVDSLELDSLEPVLDSPEEELVWADSLALLLPLLLVVASVLVLAATVLEAVARRLDAAVSAGSWPEASCT